MTVLTKFDPFRDVNQFQNTLNRLFTNWEPRFAARPFGSNDELMTSGNFVPAVDIYEDEHALRLKFEVPGIDQKELDIRLENNTLTVRGEKKTKTDEKKGNVLYQGIAARTFERAFQLADHVEVKGAKLENGLLHVDLVREVPEAAKPRQIPIGNGQTQTVEVKPVEAKAA